MLVVRNEGRSRVRTQAGAIVVMIHGTRVVALSVVRDARERETGKHAKTYVISIVDRHRDIFNKAVYLASRRAAPRAGRARVCGSEVHNSVQSELEGWRSDIFVIFLSISKF